MRTAGVGYGIGRHPINSWTATFQTFRIGDEEVKNAVLEIGDVQLSDADMLIGADFLLSHRVYVANSEHKLFFSYLGGPVFNLDQAPTAKTTGAAAAAVAGAPADSPADASSLNRRGAAFAARHDYVDAIADFTRAATLEPANARPLYDRGMAHWRNDEPAAARADFDAAIKLDPRDADALLARGELRLDAKDDDGAAADFDAARRIEPDDLLAIGAYYAEAGRFEPAVAAYDQWIAVNPKAQPAASAFNGRCWTRVVWGKDLDAALADCNAAVRREAGNPAFLDTRGYAFLRLGQPEKAVSDYDAALRIDPKQASSLYGRGVAELRLGRKSQGDADIAAAAALAPGLPAWAKAKGFAP